MDREARKQKILTDSRVKDAIISRIKKDLDYEMYENYENTLDYDDGEMDSYHYRMECLREQYEEVIAEVCRADVLEMNDDDLKKQIIDSGNVGKKCECVSDKDNMKLYNLIYDGKVETLASGTKVAHVFCDKCKKYSDSIHYTTITD